MSNMDTLTVDLKEIRQWAQEGGKLVFTPKAEEAVIKLLQMRDVIEHYYEEVKKAIAEAGTAIDPDFKGVRGDKVQATYRMFGEKYTYDLDLFDKAEAFLNKKESYKVDSKLVDLYLKKKGTLPEGVTLKMRSPVISLTPTDDGKAEVSSLVQSTGDVA